MKIAVFGVPRHLNWYAAVDYAKKVGADAIEPYPQAELAAPDLKQAAAIGKYAKDAGMPVCCFSMGVDLAHNESAVDTLKRYADVCAELGSPFLHHTLVPGLQYVPQGAEREELILRAADRARIVFDYAATIGIRCVYEDQGMCVNGIEAYSRFRKALGRDAGVVADIGNIRFVDETPLPFVEAFREKVCHVHVKDYSVFQEAPEITHYTTRGGNFIREDAIGEGGTWPIMGDLFRTLHETGFDGYYAIEYEQQKDMESAHISGIANMRALYARTCG